MESMRNCEDIISFEKKLSRKALLLELYEKIYRILFLVGIDYFCYSLKCEDLYF